MKALSSLGIGFSTVSGFLLLALIAEVYYLFWWKNRAANREIEYKTPARELLYLFRWKKPSSLNSAVPSPQEICNNLNTANRSDDVHIHCSYNKDLMRLHSLSGPSRFLYTIKEETKEDLESDSEKNLNDFLIPAEVPFLSPLPSPPLTPLDSYSHLDSSKVVDLSSRIRSSPPPMFKFLYDAEEKLYRRTIMEKALAEDVAKEKSSGPPHSPLASVETVACTSHCPIIKPAHW